MGTGSPDALPRLPPRGVITKAGGAAGDAAAGVLDPAAPPPAGGPCQNYFGGVVRFQIDQVRFQNSLTSFLGHASVADPSPTPHRFLPSNHVWATCFPSYFSIIFRLRFWSDLGSFWGANLGSFSAFLAPKSGQVRSKTRFESLSTSKT